MRNHLVAGKLFLGWLLVIAAYLQCNLIWNSLQLLFICSRNQWRSPTAEAIFNKAPHTARSAGTASTARIRVSEKLLRWADLIFVMEKKHRQQLQEKFPDVLEDKEVVVLDIPDDYAFMDEALIGILEDAVPLYLND